MCMSIHLVAALLSTCSATTTSFRIASYNIDCRVCDWPKHEHGPSFHVRTERERAVLSEIDPDIILLEEPFLPSDTHMMLPTNRNWTVLYENRTRVLPLLPKYDPDASLAIDADKFVVDAWDFLWLGPHPSRPGGFDIFTMPRVAVWASVRARASNASFVVAGTHFDHGDGTGRSTGPSTTNCVQSAREIVRLLRNDSRLAGRPLLFGGDLNSRHVSNAMDVLLNGTGLRDTWLVAPKSKTVYANTSAAASTYNFSRAIDHILATPHWDVLKAGASVRAWDVKGKPEGPSDHWPVFAEVSLRQDAGSESDQL